MRTGIQWVLNILRSAVFFVLIILSIFNILIRSTDLEQLIFSQVPVIAPGNTDERQQVSVAIRQYLFHDQALPSAFTERERLHMRDVKGLIAVVYTAWFFIILIVALLLYIQKGSLRDRFFSMSRRMGWLLAVFFVFSVSSFIFFEQFFTWFHQVSFANDLWLLDPQSSALIRSYPPDFFKFFFVICIVVSMLTILCLVLASLKRKKRS